jgi:hypothetical protein
MKNKFTPRYFLKKFAVIPDEQWMTGTYSSIKGGVQACCALGHCGVQWAGPRTREATALIRLYQKVPVILVSDGKNWGRNNFLDLGLKPKERMLNSLLLIEAGLWKDAIEGPTWEKPKLTIHRLTS